MHVGPDLAPIDALAPLVHGCYVDQQVTVARARPRRPDRHAVRTDHFEVIFTVDRVHVGHRMPPSEVDDDLAVTLHRELFGPGWLRGGDLFERVFTGVVRTGAVDAVDAWELFYRNTMARLERSTPVHEHAVELLAGDSVLELGCCFGFLSLRTARSGRPTIASDVSQGTIRLLETMAPRLGVRLGTVTADAARFPAPDALADTVLVVRLLERLEPEDGAQVLAEAFRLAVRRVVVGVPLATEPDEAFGHVRTLSLDDLRHWGRVTGRPFEVHEHHGGWLVVDVDHRPVRRRTE